MHAIKFRYSNESENDIGISGWILESAPFFDPSVEMGIAHDVVEHKKDDKGTIEEELEATGAFLFTRIESGFLSGLGISKNEAEIIADNVLDPIVTLASNQDGLTKLLNEGLVFTANSKSINNLSDYAESVINKSISKLKAKLRDSENFEGYSISDKNKRLLINKLKNEDTLNRIKGLLRSGYRRAYTRFNGDSCLASDAMINCKKAVVKAEKEFEDSYGGIISGSKLTVSVNGNTGEVSARIDSPKYYGEPFLSIGAVVSYGKSKVFNRSSGFGREY